MKIERQASIASIGALMSVFTILNIKIKNHKIKNFNFFNLKINNLLTKLICLLLGILIRRKHI